MRKKQTLSQKLSTMKWEAKNSIKKWYKNSKLVWYIREYTGIRKRSRLEDNIKQSFYSIHSGSWSDQDLPSIRQYGITKITFTHKTKKLIMNLSLQYPGAFIGKGGANFDKVRERLAKIAECEFEIHIIESDPFKCNYTLNRYNA